MAEQLQHFSHECALTLPEIVADGICNICYEDKPVEFLCNSCNFDLCKDCSKLPQKVSHAFHPEHHLEFCLRQYDQKPGCIICSGCGNMSSASFYECEECEIYLDLGCALQANIFKGWDAEAMLHDSHRHLLKRSRPGPDARGCCLLCELPLSPSAICYGCVHCYSFVHERCLDLPTEIQHPVHPEHPLKRLDYIQTHEKGCDACKYYIVGGVPFGCLECDFNLHVRCADSLLRGLMHKSHQHKLFYVVRGAGLAFDEESPCQICMRTSVISLDSYYHCVECGMKFHFECLEIPEFVFKKSHHIHPLVCEVFVAEDDCFEYCGVCETMVHAKHHSYSCKECDFIGHVECVLREEVPSPLYLKHMYTCGEDSMRPIDGEICDETNELENKLMVHDREHTHVMRLVDLSEINEVDHCYMCLGKIFDSLCKCEICSFQTHHHCAELGKQSRRQLHCNHPLTLLPVPLDRMSCDYCKKEIEEFNLFCRLCNFIIDIKCALKGKFYLGVLRMGQKIIGTWGELCMKNTHNLFQVIISESHPMACTICDERLSGKGLSCMTCEDIYHPMCIQLRRRGLAGHPLHSDHRLVISLTSGSKCITCKLDMTKYGYHCFICKVNFHVKCIKSVNVLGNIRSHSHYLYNFWVKDSELTRGCTVCGRPCCASFYGCIDCNFSAHVECIGFPDNVKNKMHHHTVKQMHRYGGESCSLCGSKCLGGFYSCSHCKDSIHMECIISTGDREPATEEEQLQDIYLMSFERNLSNLLRLNSEYLVMMNEE